MLRKLVRLLERLELVGDDGELPKGQRVMGFGLHSRWFRPHNPRSAMSLKGSCFRSVTSALTTKSGGPEKEKKEAKFFCTWIEPV